MIIAIIASALLTTNAMEVAKSEEVAQTNQTWETEATLIENCRAMIPREVELKGRLILRNRRGIELAEHQYKLKRSGSTMKLWIDGEEIAQKIGAGIKGTDVTWSDLTLDYLWWDNVVAEASSESVHGQTCRVLRLSQGTRTMKVWVDRKTGVLMQAEELEDGKTIRRLWGSRIKKFGNRWMANVMEVETMGSGHRTKITVEELK